MVCLNLRSNNSLFFFFFLDRQFFLTRYPFFSENEHFIFYFSLENYTAQMVTKAQISRQPFYWGISNQWSFLYFRISKLPSNGAQQLGIPITKIDLDGDPQVQQHRGRYHSIRLVEAHLLIPTTCLQDQWSTLWIKMPVF